MKRRAILMILALGVLGPLLGLHLPAQAPDRYLDHVSAGDTNVRLVVFNPEPFNIRALEALRKNQIIDIPNLTVIGVYHVKQS